MKQRCW